MNLETREIPIPRKTQVKSILSCPLLSSSPDPTLIPTLTLTNTPAPDPNPNPKPIPKPVSSISPALDLDQEYAQVSKAAAPPCASGAAGVREKVKRPRELKEKRREGGGGSPTPALLLQESAYSLPFDHLAAPATWAVTATDSRETFGRADGADPLYDSIDDSQVKRILQGTRSFSKSGYSLAEHIYDQPEGYGQPLPPASMYDDPVEVRAEAWRTMAIESEPTCHERPYNVKMDDYAVPKHCRAAVAHQGTGGGTEGEEEDPYRNGDSGVARENS